MGRRWFATNGLLLCCSGIFGVDGVPEGDDTIELLASLMLVLLQHYGAPVQPRGRARNDATPALIHLDTASRSASSKLDKYQVTKVCRNHRSGFRNHRGHLSQFCSNKPSAVPDCKARYVGMNSTAGCSLLQNDRG